MQISIKSITYDDVTVLHNTPVIRQILETNTLVKANIVFDGGVYLEGEFSFPYKIESCNEAETKIKECINKYKGV